MAVRRASWIGLVLAFSAGLGGCASTSTDSAALMTSSLPAGKGRIVLERTNETLFATTAATAKLNGQTVAKVAVGDTAVVDVAPGAAQLSVEAWAYPGSYTIPIEVRPGETVKVEISPREGTGASAMLGPIGAMMDKDEKGNGGAFSARQVANLDINSAPAASTP